MALRCMIVDDNGAFLDAARVLLERQGIDVVGIASTPGEALESAEQLRPQVILVDVRLGEESGVALARQLAEAGATTVMISTHAEVDVAELVSASGAAGFLPKSQLSASRVLAFVDGESPDPGDQSPA